MFSAVVLIDALKILSLKDDVISRVMRKISNFKISKGIDTSERKSKPLSRLKTTLLPEDVQSGGKETEK